MRLASLLGWLLGLAGSMASWPSSWLFGGLVACPAHEAWQKTPTPTLKIFTKHFQPLGCAHERSLGFASDALCSRYVTGARPKLLPPEVRFTGEDGRQLVPQGPDGNV